MIVGLVWIMPFNTAFLLIELIRVYPSVRFRRMCVCVRAHGNGSLFYSAERGRNRIIRRRGPIHGITELSAPVNAKDRRKSNAAATGRGGLAVVDQI